MLCPNYLKSTAPISLFCKCLPDARSPCHAYSIQSTIRETTVYAVVCNTAYIHKITGILRLARWMPASISPILFSASHRDPIRAAWSEITRLGYAHTKKPATFDNAYAEMPLMQKEILRLLFVEEMKPGLIAKKLNCSPQYVYNQRFKALQKFRQALSEGGEENG